MGKIVEYKVYGYYIYYTMHCLSEGIIHVHTNPNNIGSERNAGKFFVYEDGRSRLEKKGCMSDKDVLKIQGWIKDNIDIIKNKWLDKSKESGIPVDFFRG